MRNRKKRWGVGVLAALMITALGLTGCGSSKKAEKKGTAKAEEIKMLRLSVIRL